MYIIELPHDGRAGGWMDGWIDGREGGETSKARQGLCKHTASHGVGIHCRFDQLDPGTLIKVPSKRIN